MAKLVEVGLHLIMLQQGGSVSCGLTEVSHHGSHSHLPHPIREQATGL